MRQDAKFVQTPRKELRILVLGLATLTYAVLLIAGTNLSGVRTVELAGGGSAAGWDKLLHMGSFFGLGLLLTWLFASLESHHSPAVPWLIAASYAAFHEGIQLWIPGLTFNLLDLLADLIGVTLGVLLLVLARRESTTVTATGVGRQ